MRIRIERRIPEAGYYPGQILVDHARENEWLNDGSAAPAPEPAETAALDKGETATRKPGRRK